MAKSTIHLGIEAGESALKFALLDVKAKKVLRTEVVHLEKSPLSSSAYFENAVNEWMSAHSLPKPACINVALPAYRGTIRDVTLPADADDVHDYLRWELCAALGVSSPDDFYFDYELQPDSRKPVRAVVAAFRRSMLDVFRGIHKKDLQPAVVEPDLFSLLNLYEMADGLASELRCVIKADRAGILAAWGNDSGIVALRWCATTGLGVDPDSEIFPRMAESLAQSIADSGSSYKDAFKTIRICGELSTETGFTDVLAQQLKTQGFELSLWDSFLKLSLNAEGNFPRNVLHCCGAIGVALRAAGDRK